MNVERMLYQSMEGDVIWRLLSVLVNKRSIESLYQ